MFNLSYMIKLVVITGPTATGKTALGIELAKKFNGEIVSADSQQVYVGQDEERGKDRSFPQWGLDLVSSGFNVSDWVKYSSAKISEIIDRKKIPIIVGGSGQYIKELLNPSETLHIPVNRELRKKLAKYSIEELQKLIKIKMNDSDFKNPRRLIRAIEVVEHGSRLPAGRQDSQYDALVIGLTAKKEIIYQKIVARRKERPDLVEKEFKLAKKQLLYMQKYLNAVWFDIADPKMNNKIEWLVTKFIQPPLSKKNVSPHI